ncbi:expressed unknown protein [Seminavis robusta]|uniref:G-protein coupled receptors family 1 profile domain-containing protein n=1 Tax=Seminavis robusta TaxID=568900 RepID=A0A9N8D4Y0_9STRA|nr:expressed unknown protein [Seminavis robusta]|eukprot:Sro5_g004360.1 n/a (420) ;mRNA; f:135111-136477
MSQSPTGTDDYDDSTFAYYVPLIVLGTITSTLSILGSGCIVYMSSRPNQLRYIKQRLLLALSISDMLSSAFWMLMPYLAPKWVGTPGAVGNHASCTAGGFFILVFTKVSSTYNAYLSICFLLIVRGNWKEHDFRKPLEIGAHVLATTLPLIVDIPAAVTQSINPTPLFANLCMYGPYPLGCVEEDECERSSKATSLIFVAASVPLFWIWTIVGLICTAIVWWTARKTFRRNNQYNFEQSNIRQSIGQSSDRTSIARSSESNNDKMVREMGTQAALYEMAYLNSCIWPLLMMILFGSISDAELAERNLQPGFYILKLLTMLFYPSQGAWNFFVYTRPKVLHWKKAQPDYSTQEIYRAVLSGKMPPSRSRSGRKPKSGEQAVDPNQPTNRNGEESTEEDEEKTNREVVETRQSSVPIFLRS